ncbi:TonB-linked SusC/RagA family outer membrane protein [Catalinimonas alkaloidigena]|uniref:SusC/RagA family TonB-linked outer membrane protein n=1 Tax=Catalinimonas alkaloidigena TaxID=1075417 RepID=UPI002406915F|nr:TonB-dependent receptor [Catalinimonas alkaloidigena]MDF9795422.1 TonB-linked SusC/RagA family outer membrane protein [Catalinimonas alkaloidigena]
MMKHLLMIFSLLLFISFQGYGQERTVSGKILDENEDPLPGVNVVVKGTTIGTISDIEGNYSLSVGSNDAILEFSFLGFKNQEIQVGNQSTINVNMEPDLTELSEVVVVGYGTKRKEELTGSVNVVDSESIQQVPTPSFQDALQGSSPGVQVVSQDGAPGAGISIRIRGIGSINASNEPLYVIDGIPITSGSGSLTTTDFDNGGRSANPLASINPNDIENIVILKDASSTAIYGARGANGVVLITTKQGSQGAAKIDLKARVGFSSPAFNNLLEPLNEEQYRQLYVEGYVNNGSYDTEQEALEFYNQQFPDQADTDWLDEITQTGVTQDYNISVSGGSEKLRYFVSGNVLQQDGIVVNNKFDRYSSRANLSASLTDRLTLTNNLTLSYFNQRGITDGTRWQAPFYVAYLMAPTIPVYDDQGLFYAEHADFFMGGNNPRGHLSDDRREREQTRIIDNLSIDYEILDNLSFRSAWSFDLIQVDDYIFNNGRYGDGRNANGSAQEAATDQLNWLGTQTLNYNNTFGEAHNIDVLLGYEAQHVKTDQLDISTEGFSHPSLIYVSAGANPQSETFNSRSEFAFQSLFSRVSYDFDQKYYLTASLRRDGSSRFGPESRYGTFWSIGGAYSISEEGFMQNVGFVDFLKLRASYGKTGNANIDDNNADTDDNYLWAETYGFAREYDGTPGAAPLSIGNPGLTWESQGNFNVGVDFTGFNNRVNANVEYFIRQSTDLILNRPLSRTTGFREQLSNISDMENRGIEIQLGADLISTPDFLLNAGINFTAITNEITSLDEAIVDGTKRREEGRDFQEYYLYGWAGVDPANGDPLWYTDETKSETTNQINNALRFYDGKSATPDFFGAFNLRAQYKAFTLSGQLNYQFGNYVYDGPGWVIHGDGRFTPRSTSTYAFNNRWTTPGQQAIFPQHRWGGNQSSNQQDSDRYLFEGDYMRLRTVSLAYNLPASVLSTLNLRSLQLSVLMNNFWTWTKDDQLYFDPEQTISGVYNTVTPINKTVSFVLNIGI